MPILKLEFDKKGKPANPPAQFLALFNSFFRDYGVIETSDEEVMYKGQMVNKRDVYWEEFGKRMNELFEVARGTDFEAFAFSMVYSFSDAISKTQNRYTRMVERQMERMEAEAKKKQRQLAKEQAMKRSEGEVKNESSPDNS